MGLIGASDLVSSCANRQLHAGVNQHHTQIAGFWLQHREPGADFVID
jgi:hypothetical protein